MEQFVTGVGVGLAAVGIAISLAGIGARITYLRNMLNSYSLPLWFRAEGLVLLGGALLFLGLVILGELARPFVVAAAVFGAAALAFLRINTHWR